MADYSATVEWRSDGAFRENRYSRAHSWRFDGGTVVPASASPANVPAGCADPAGVDPEEALVASVSSCHMLWFLHLAREAGHDVAGYKDDARGTLGRNREGRVAFKRVTLRPQVTFAGEPPSKEALERLHHEAHARCFIANSLNAEVVVEG